jgi:hypothetical protein
MEKRGKVNAHGRGKAEVSQKESEEVLNLDIASNKEARGPYVFHQVAYVAPKPPYDGRHITTWLSGLPRGTKAVSVWATENFGSVADGSEPHAGNAKFFTHSVQLAGRGSVCRVIWSVDWPGAGEMTLTGSLLIIGVAENM